MSLDETARSVWNLQTLPLAALVAGRGHVAIAARLPEPLLRASDELTLWFPARKESIADLHARTILPCFEAHAALPDAAARATGVSTALEGLYLQLTILERHATRRGLPADCPHLTEDHFVKHLREVTKLEPNLDLRGMDARLTALLAIASVRGAKWPDLVALGQRQGWGRLARSLGDASTRVRDIVTSIDVGGTAERADVGGREALRVSRADGTKQVAVLTPEEKETLFSIVPWATPS